MSRNLVEELPKNEPLSVMLMLPWNMDVLGVSVWPMLQLMKATLQAGDVVFDASAVAAGPMKCKFSNVIVAKLILEPGPKVSWVAGVRPTNVGLSPRAYAPAGTVATA